MKKKGTFFLALVLVFLLCLPIPTKAAGGDFSSHPQTPYATTFITACEGQQWFINEVERLLNARQMTLNTITSNADFKYVTSIGLRGEKISGKIPAAIGELTELQYLFLADNQLSGAIPASLYALPKLQNVDLANNAYAGSIPEGFGTMAALKTLNLRGNSYTGTIPATILGNTTLTYFDVSSNKLSGVLPAGLNGMTSLQYLAVADNDWKAGNLPDLSALTNLKALSAWNCNLSGAIPESLYALTALQVLDLDSNKLSGELSGNLANLANLQLLSIGNNRIGGAIPDGLGALTHLITLDISNNRLRGKLPATVADCETVYAENNYLTGEVLKGIANNAGNFCDGAVSNQYQLMAASPVTISKTSTTNLYGSLKNTGSGGIKPLLPVDCYVATVKNDPSHKVTLTTDANGIYVQANSDMAESENITVEVMILANDGSAYSKAMIRLTTGAVNIGGGSTGGGAPSVVPAVTHAPYIQGFSDNTFRPDANVTREQVAAMITRAFEGQITTPSADPYSDVKADRWSAGNIQSAKENGYLFGYQDSTFRPEKPMTRAELAVCLVRIVEKQNAQLSAGVAQTFSDVVDSDWYADYVAKASALGLITGYKDGTFRPNDTVSRAEAVTMINRMLERKPETSADLHTKTNPFTDITEKTCWAYWNILEASLSHTH